MNETFLYVLAGEQELNKLLEGQSAGYPITWRGLHHGQRLGAGQIGVLWREPRSSADPVRPSALVAAPEELRRLFGRIGQLRPDLSPITSWCHVLPPARFDPLDGPVRHADLIGLEAAWTGLAIAEALLLSERSVGKLRLAACLATQSYAIARTLALWEQTAIGEVLDRYDTAHGIMRSSGSGASRLRAGLQPVWSALAAATSFGSGNTAEYRNIVEAIQALVEARTERPNEDEAEAVYRALRSLPEAEILRDLPKLTPEARVREFDQVIEALGRSDADHTAQRNELSFLAGYLATVAAGGAPSLALAEDLSQTWPAVTAWAYAIGGLGERRTWTASFDGLGRLVARELGRPFRLDEAPTSDFSLEEAVVLADPQLSDPLVHLRIKQMRVVTVSLLPGVNVSIPVNEPAEARRPPGVEDSRKLPPAQTTSADAFSSLAEALWPHFRGRVTEILRNSQVDGGNAKKPYRARPRKTDELPL